MARRPRNSGGSSSAGAAKARAYTSPTLAVGSHTFSVRSIDSLGGTDPTAYQGKATCYIEFGGAAVARMDVNSLGGPTPTGIFAEPSLAIAGAKKDFGARRRQRWFGHTS